MPVRTQNETQQMLTKPISCRRGQNMYLKLCKPNPPMPGRTQIVCQFVFINIFHERQDTQCISTCVDQTHPLPARTLIVFQFEMTKLHPMPVGTQNEFQYVLTKHMPC